MEKDTERKVWRVTLAVTLLFLAVLCFALWHSGFFLAIRTPQGIQEYIQRFAPYSHLVFFLIQLASVILAPAFLLTAGAVILGSAIVFQLGRALGKPFVERFVSAASQKKYGELILRKRDSFLFLAFLFPFFPDDILCIMAGLTDISFRRFLLLVALARPWGLLVASAVGGSVLHIPLWGMILLGLGGILLFVLAMKYGDRFEAAVMEKLKRDQ